MEKMLAKDLTKSEKEMYRDMLRRHSSLFISNYEQISGVTVVQPKTKVQADGKKATEVGSSATSCIVIGGEDALTSRFHLSN